MNEEKNEPVTVIEASVKYAIDLMRMGDKSPEMVTAIAELLNVLQKWD